MGSRKPILVSSLHNFLRQIKIVYSTLNGVLDLQTKQKNYLSPYSFGTKNIVPADNAKVVLTTTTGTAAEAASVIIAETAKSISAVCYQSVFCTNTQLNVYLYQYKPMYLEIEFQF